MFVQTEITPNPNSLKFLPGKKVSNDIPIEIINKNESNNELIRNRPMNKTAPDMGRGFPVWARGRPFVNARSTETSCLTAFAQIHRNR